MTSIAEAFPSKYIKAHDLQGKAHTVTMQEIVMEKIGNDEKPVLYFRGKQKGFVLNRTNANTIADAYGDETDDWTGNQITIFPAVTDFQGRTTDCIRVRVGKLPSRSATKAPTVMEPPPPISHEDYGASIDDEIPF